MKKLIAALDVISWILLISVFLIDDRRSSLTFTQLVILIGTVIAFWPIMMLTTACVAVKEKDRAIELQVWNDFHLQCQGVSTMGKILNSNEILQLARDKAKERKLAFDDYDCVKDKPPLEQMLFFCFLNMECLYQRQKLSKEAKKKYEAIFENVAQQAAEAIYPMLFIYGKTEQKLQTDLRAGDYKAALLSLAAMHDFSRFQIFESKYSMLCKEFIERNNTDVEDL